MDREDFHRYINIINYQYHICEQQEEINKQQTPTRVM